MQEVKIDSTQKIHIGVAPVDASGNPANIDGAVTFEVTSGDATVAPDEDGKGAFLISGATASESKIMVSADADLGEGIETISEEISLVVSLPKAVSLGLNIGTPEPK